MTGGVDAIVLGAGLGGMVAAARLARAGLKVVCLDRNRHPGGTAYAYERQGFSLPMGPLGFSSPAAVRSALEGIGVELGPDLRRNRYRVRAFGLDLPLCLPPDELTAELGRLFPAEAEGVRRFFAEVRAIGAALSGEGGEADRATLERAARVPAAGFIRPLFKDARLRRALGGMGTGEPYSSLLLLGAMWRLLSEEGIWRPAEGLARLCDRIAGAARVSGVEFGLGAAVARIKVANGKVQGVALEDGGELEAPRLIAAADYKTVFLRLLEAEAQPEAWFQGVFHARLTRSNLQVGVGVDRARADLSAFAQATSVLYRAGGREAASRPALDADWRRLEVDLEEFRGQELEISLVGDDGEHAPPGQAALLIRTVADYGHFARYRTGWGKRVPVYAGYKERLGRALLAEAEAVVPGLVAAARLLDVATPLTFEERGGRSAGAVAGWSWDFEDAADLGPRELILTPIRGLYMAGHQAYSSMLHGGVPGALLSGTRAAELALAGAGPRLDSPFP